MAWQRRPRRRGPERDARAGEGESGRFPVDAGRRVGYFNPSNIIERDGYYYVMVFSEHQGAQERGVCLLRTRDLAEPSAWRAWDGTGFEARFANPYQEQIEHPDRHVCAPVARDNLTGLVTSLTRHEGSGLYIALTAGHLAPRPGADEVTPYKGGELDGKKYKETRHYSTLVFVVGEPAGKR